MGSLPQEKWRNKNRKENGYVYVWLERWALGGACVWGGVIMVVVGRAWVIMGVVGLRMSERSIFTAELPHC